MNYLETLDKEKVISKFDSVLERGLCSGIGSVNSQMCIEAAITQALDLPFSDQPNCVAESVRKFKIALNDKNWSSSHARAKALRNLGIAQIGSKGIIDDKEFYQLLSKKMIQVLIPTLFREIFIQKDNILHQNCLNAALECENNPIKENVLKAKNAADAADAVADAAAVAAAAVAYYAAVAVAYYAAVADAYYAADADAYYVADAAAVADAYASKAKDKYLILVADLALEVLKELKSPGCEWL